MQTHAEGVRGTAALTGTAREGRAETRSERQAEASPEGLQSPAEEFTGCDLEVLGHGVRLETFTRTLTSEWRQMALREMTGSIARGPRRKAEFGRLRRYTQNLMPRWTLGPGGCPEEK